MIKIAVVNQKGGVGKTTTAVNVAAGLALEGRRTLLVDLDPQGNATSGLGLNRDEIEHTIFEALLSHAPVDGCLAAASVAHLTVLPADIRLIAAEKHLLETDHREQQLAGVLQPLGGRFDYAVIDCPPSLGLLTLNAMCAAEKLLVPVQSEYYALEGLSMLLDTFERVRSSINPRLEILGVLMTMVDGRTNLARQVVEEVLKHFGDKVFQTVLARSVRLSEAPSYGESILTYDPRSAAAEAYRRLTSEVIRRCESLATSNNTAKTENNGLEEWYRQENLHVVSGQEPSGNPDFDKTNPMTGEVHEHQASPSLGA